MYFVDYDVIISIAKAVRIQYSSRAALLYSTYLIASRFYGYSCVNAGV
jgi:hypothetical protein